MLLYVSVRVHVDASLFSNYECPLLLKWSIDNKCADRKIFFCNREFISSLFKFLERKGIIWPRPTPSSQLINNKIDGVLLVQNSLNGGKQSSYSNFEYQKNQCM